MTFSGIWSISSLMTAIVRSIALRRISGPKPFSGCALGLHPMRSSVSSSSANAHSLSVPPVTVWYHASPSRSASRRLMCFHPPSPPLCMNIRQPYENGWQLSSLSVPSVAARTCAKTSRDAVLLAMRSRFEQFHAGTVERKTHGVCPSLGSV